MINNWLPALILSLIVCLVVQEAEASLISEFAAIDTPLDNGTGVTLNWRWGGLPSEGMRLRIERSTISNPGQFDLVEQPSPSSQTLYDQGLAADQEYLYRFTLTDDDHIVEVGVSSPVTPRFDIDLANLEVTDALDASGDSIALNWQWRQRKDLGFHLLLLIERKESEAEDFFEVAKIDPAIGSFLDNGLIEGSNYHYRLTILRAEGFEPGSARWLSSAVTVRRNFVFETLQVNDIRNDQGDGLELRWRFRQLDSLTSPLLHIERVASDGSLSKVAEVAPADERYTETGLTENQPYCYRLTLFEAGKPVAMLTSAEAVPVYTVFNPDRFNALFLFVLFCSIVLWLINTSRRGKDLFIRRIAGLNAIEDAIGRATEMGRKILYIPGIMSMDEVQTIASLSILGYVARYAADYDTLFEVPNKDPITFAAARETVREAFLTAGKSDKYREDMVTYITYDQFAYTASVCGKMVRERPAANFLIGSFYAESLLLAETGQLTGAIQIAGTAEVHQLPFFVCACDYTLIGEELYAASAYISKDPLMVGSIKGQDWVKAILIGVLLLGVILETAGVHWLTAFLQAK